MLTELFKGLQRNVDQTDIADGKCYNCSNIDLSTYGVLSNITGLSKITTSSIEGQAMAVYQLGSYVYAVANGKVWRL